MNGGLTLLAQKRAGPAKRPEGENASVPLSPKGSGVVKVYLKKQSPAIQRLASVHENILSYEGVNYSVIPFLFDIWSFCIKTGDFDITVPTNNGNWYEVSLNHLLNWDDAQNVCRRKGGFLAVIQNTREKKNIANAIMEFLNENKSGPKWKTVWIGLKKGNN